MTALLEEYRQKMMAVASGEATASGGGEVICKNRRFEASSKAAKALLDAIAKGQQRGGKAVIPDWRTLPPLP